MSHERVERVRAGYAAFNRGEFEVGLEGIADDVTWEVLDVFPEKGPFHGKEGILRFWQSWAETFSEFRAEIDEIVDLEEHIVVVMHMSGRGHGSAAPMRTPSFAQIWTFEGDQISRTRMLPDREQAVALVGAEGRKTAG
jgi:ketosteroid isomerase-like protein